MKLTFKRIKVMDKKNEELDLEVWEDWNDNAWTESCLESSEHSYNEDFYDDPNLIAEKGGDYYKMFSSSSNKNLR